MRTAITRSRTSFNLRTDVLDILKHKAMQANSSLETYVEGVLAADAYDDVPNELTCAAIIEAQDGKRDPGEVYDDVDNMMRDLMKS